MVSVPNYNYYEFFKILFLIFFLWFNTSAKKIQPIILTFNTFWKKLFIIWVRKTVFWGPPQCTSSFFSIETPSRPIHLRSGAKFMKTIHIFSIKHPPHTYFSGKNSNFPVTHSVKRRFPSGAQQSPSPLKIHRHRLQVVLAPRTSGPLCIISTFIFFPPPFFPLHAIRIFDPHVPLGAWKFIKFVFVYRLEGERRLFANASGKISFSQHAGSSLFRVFRARENIRVWKMKLLSPVRYFCPPIILCF